MSETIAFVKHIPCEHYEPLFQYHKRRTPSPCPRCAEIAQAVTAETARCVKALKTIRKFNKPTADYTEADHAFVEGLATALDAIKALEATDE